MGVLFQIAVVHAHLLTLERALAVLAEGIDVGEVSAPVRGLSVTFAGRDNSFLCTFVIQLAPVMFLLAAVVTSAPVQRPFGDSEEDAPSTTQSVTPNFTRHFLGCLAAACVLIAIVPLNAELLSLGSSTAAIASPSCIPGLDRINEFLWRTSLRLLPPLVHDFPGGYVLWYLIGNAVLTALARLGGCYRDMCAEEPIVK